MRKRRRKVTFDDVAGNQLVKDELRQIVTFLQDPQRVQKLGARAPRGILFEGESGTGKTLLAKALANEAGVPFFYASASSFVEIYVGQGAARVRDIFDNARRNAPCIVFIDEIDALGVDREAISGASHEHIQTVNQLLTEMDGMSDDSEMIVVIGATNRFSALDEALTRPGRFDRVITIPLPTTEERLQMLYIHSNQKAVDPSVNFASIAERTPGCTGADLESLLNDAALLAARQGENSIQPKHLEASLQKLIHRKQKIAESRTEKFISQAAYRSQIGSNVATLD